MTRTGLTAAVAPLFAAELAHLPPVGWGVLAGSELGVLLLVRWVLDDADRSKRAARLLHGRRRR